MTFTLPDDRLADPAFLAASIHKDRFLSGGTNNDVWRIDGLGAGTRPHILRVSRHRRALFTSINNPPRADIFPQASMDARAAQPLVVFHARDTDGEHNVGDVQPELKGALLGLTRTERASRSRTINVDEDRAGKIIDMGDGISLVLPKFAKSVRTEANPEGIRITNIRLWDVATRLANMPVSFFVQLIKDAKEIEEAGFGIDPSKGENFMLLDGENRIGFVDLMPKDYKYRMTPGSLAVVLWQPANQTWGIGQTEADERRRTEMDDIIHAKMIAAADLCRLEYTYTESMKLREARLREQFGLVKPQGVRLIKIDDHIPVGHYSVKAKDIIVPRDENTAPRFPVLQARL